MSQDTNIENLIINKLTKAQYESIETPDPTQLYFITDEVISSEDVVNALGYTPYNSTNPNGYTSNIGTVTSVNNTQPDASGNVALTIPDTATWGNITGTLSNQTDLQTALNGKQDELTAGDNITIEQQEGGWTAAVQDSNLGEHNWLPLAYDGTKFVALSVSGYVSTSTDGTTWTQATDVYNLGDKGWAALAYDGTKLVALGYEGYVSTSTDGTTWSAAVQDSNLGANDWAVLAYDGTKLVALGDGGYISTSTDGTTWSVAVQDSNLGEHEWIALAYDGTKFVALGISGYVSTSTDGTTWTQATQDSNLGANDWGALAYDGTKFVALGDGGYISTSLSELVISATVPSPTWGSITGTLSDQTDLQTALNGKQATLVSGTNIKTINNNSILGSGNLTLDGLPSQTGQSGKFLTTDGTDASWATVTIPTPTYDSTNERITW